MNSFFPPAVPSNKESFLWISPEWFHYSRDQEGIGRFYCDIFRGTQMHAKSPAQRGVLLVKAMTFPMLRAFSIIFLQTKECQLFACYSTAR